MELTSHALRCSAALDLLLTKFGKSDAFISSPMSTSLRRVSETRGTVS